MCTVSFLPLNDRGYIITSNRDEAPLRNASETRRVTGHRQHILYPVDPESGGSWFAISDRGRTVCLLNGAFAPFVPDPRFTRSRGLVLLDAVSFPSGNWLTEEYDLTHTAPFTLVIAESDALIEQVWDGTRLVTHDLPMDTPAFWSSVTLYPEHVREWRRSLFHAWLEDHTHFNQESVMRFHRFGGSQDTWNGFVMNRQERVRTLSITSVLCRDDVMLFCHDNLISGETLQEEIHVTSQHVEKD